MKQSKILTTSLLTAAAVLALLFVAGCGNNAPAVILNGNPAQGGSQPATIHNVNLINITQENVTISPTALPIAEAAQVGIQYILDIFGKDVAGMYVELEFANWDHLTRTLWHGAVSDVNRNSMEFRLRSQELNDALMARLEAGEEWEDVMADMAEEFRLIRYTPALFYFFIDADSGKRIDIWRQTDAQRHAMDESISLPEYIEQEWDGDWEAAFSVDIDPQEIHALGQIARAYAQRHFNNSVVANMDFESAFASPIYTGGGFARDQFAVFVITDDTGREARVTVHVESRMLNSINTMSNDFVPMDLGEMRR